MHPNVILCYGMLRYVMRCYVIVWYVILWYVILSLSLVLFTCDIIYHKDMKIKMHSYGTLSLPFFFLSIQSNTVDSIIITTTVLLQLLCYYYAVVYKKKVRISYKRDNSFTHYCIRVSG